MSTQGSADLFSATIPPIQPAAPIAVYWYSAPGSSGGSGTLELIPNVRCLRIDRRAGGEPSTARFEYVQSQVLESQLGWPSQFEELWPLDAQGSYVVQADDWIVVASTNPDGSPLYLFSGFAQIPQADVAGDGQKVTFAAIGVEARASDDVIHTRVQRDASDPQDTSGYGDVEIHAPCRFNPQGTRANGTVGILPNSTPDANYTISDPQTDPIGYPVFIEPLLAEREAQDQVETGTYVTEWYLGDALLYLLNFPNPGDDYISWPSSQSIKDLVATKIPDSNGIFDPNTATTADLKIRDYDATNKPLPRVLADLLGYGGFYYTWPVEADGDGNPSTYMQIYRVDAAATGTPKLLYLNTYNNPLDPTLNNVCQLHLARDSAGIINAWRVETKPKQVEISVILAPAFTPATADASPSSDPTGGWNAFKSSNLAKGTATSEDRRKYRWFIADECGDGHYNMYTSQWDTTPLDLTAVFPDDPDTGLKTYSVRYRPGRDRLISVDDAGVPRKATLEVYLGASMSDPQLRVEGASSTGWLAISKGFELLPDRLGIRITIEDPEQWHTGNPDPTAQVIRTITWLAKPSDSASKQFSLRLTTTIDDDEILDGEADKRPASPTEFTRWRQSDARDHFQYTSVDPSSIYYTGTDGEPTVVRDDTKDAQADARQHQSAHEMPALAGSVTIPYLTTYYQIGDRIEAISGRDVSLQTNIGASQGEAPTYPWIVGLSWEFSGDRQQTVLQLSDRRGEHSNAY